MKKSYKTPATDEEVQEVITRVTPRFLNLTLTPAESKRVPLEAIAFGLMVGINFASHYSPNASLKIFGGYTAKEARRKVKAAIQHYDMNMERFMEKLESYCATQKRHQEARDALEVL